MPNSECCGPCVPSLWCTQADSSKVLSPESSQWDLRVLRLLDKQMNKSSVATSRWYPGVPCSCFCGCDFLKGKTESLLRQQNELKTQRFNLPTGNTWSNTDPSKFCSNQTAGKLPVRQKPISSPRHGACWGWFGVSHYNVLLNGKCFQGCGNICAWFSRAIHSSSLIGLCPGSPFLALPEILPIYQLLLWTAIYFSDVILFSYSHD